MDKLVFQMDNKLDDYFAIYPVLNKRVLFINRWTPYLLGLFLLLLGISILFSTKSSLAKNEFGYAATAATVVLVVLAGITGESIGKKKKAATFVNHLISKGAAQVTIDLVGIEIKYAKEIKLIEWTNSSQLLLESNYLMSSDSMGHLAAIIPKGSIADNRWFEIQELTTSIVKSASAKRYQLNT